MTGSILSRKALILAVSSVLAIVLLAPRISHGDETKGGYVACVSKDLFDQAIQAIVNKDNRAWKYLLKNGCVVTKKGIPISVIDWTWTGSAKVRAYLGDRTVILWTNMENINRSGQ